MSINPLLVESIRGAGATKKSDGVSVSALWGTNRVHCDVIRFCPRVLKDLRKEFSLYDSPFLLPP